MKSLKEIAIAARDTISRRWLNWRLKRYQKSMDSIVRPWRVGSTTGSTIQLGFMARRDAMQKVVDLKLGTIIYVDNEVGFIAVNPPKSDV